MHSTQLLSRSAVRAQARVGSVQGLLATLLSLVCAQYVTAQVVDRTTLNGKVMPGYQGWFCCPGDGNPGGVGWRHWSRSTTSIGPNLYTVDLWPEVSEYSTVFNAPGVNLLYGGTANLFSSVTPSTVTKHFEWMKNAGIDGVFFQRFLSELGDPTFFALRNTILQNVSAAANTHGRTWALEYDISGSAESTLYQNLTNDWIYLSNTYNIRNDPRYLYHNGKPVIVIWGLGFTDRPGTPAIATQIINFFKNDPTYGNCTCIGGVPGSWRTLNGSSKTDPAWTNVYRSWHVINPWTVGAYNNSASITNWKNNVAAPDVSLCNSLGIIYLPVVWPGFSWDNLMQLPPGTSGIDRRNGQHFWDQAYAYESLSGVNKLFVAMFDECDEGTAIFKISDNAPNTNHWVGNNGYPQDWYMRLAGAAGQMARGEIGLTPTIPISPIPPDAVTYNLGSPDLADRMTHPQVGDGNTTVNTVGGRTGRQNVNPGADYYFYFTVDDSYAFNGNKPNQYITVNYYDSGTGSLLLQYDSISGGAYKNGPSVNLTNTNTWKSVTWTLTDAYFGNRQNNGSDFRIFLGTGVTRTLDLVQVANVSNFTPAAPSVDLGTTDAINGLTPVQVGDGDTTPVTIGGRDARKNVNSGVDFYFYFNAADSFAFQGSRPNLYVKVTYYDTGTGSLTLQYDGAAGAYVSGPSVTLTNTNTWKQVSWHITDAYFANRQNNSTDFRVFLGTGVTRYLDVVQVSTTP